jgi:hypothetical protein
MKYCKNPKPSSRVEAISKRAFYGVPERHATIDERNHPDVEEFLTDRLSIANVDGQTKEQNQTGDAIPVMEEVQLKVNVALDPHTVGDRANAYYNAHENGTRRPEVDQQCAAPGRE